MMGLSRCAAACLVLLLFTACTPPGNLPDDETADLADAGLGSLSLSDGTLSPAFAPGIQTYSATVSSAVSTVTVTAMPRDANAVVKACMNGGTWVALAPGGSSAPLRLDVGENTLDLRVTAEDWSTQKTYAISVTRGWPGGYLDASFPAAGPGADDAVNAIHVQGDGSILLGGGFSSYGVTSRPHLARLREDGTLDTSFPAAGSGPNGSVLTIETQEDGRILIGGTFTLYDGRSRGRIARLHADGTLDESFLDSLAGADNAVCAIAVQDDGRILIGGFFTECNGVSAGHLARLEEDGSLDASFLAAGAATNGIVYALDIQPDDRVLVAGAFTSCNSAARGRLARLEPEGSLDLSFPVTGSGADADVYALELLADGRMLVGGSFSQWSGTSRGSLACVQPDGSLDASFLASGQGTNGYVAALAVDGDGRVILAGGFGTCAGASRGSVARLTTNGELDSTFLAAGVGANEAVRCAALAGDGRILIGGEFYAFNGIARGRLARLWAGD